LIRSGEEGEIMRWIAFFEDKPEMLQVRKEREPKHLAYLLKHMDEILLAGGCRESPESVFVGGLWLLEVSSKERAIELIESDPYYEPTLRSYKLRTWGEAFPDKRITL
jgi:uncharacterized protein YciI